MARLSVRLRAGGQPKGERKMHNFELVKPTTVEEAVAALQGDDAQPLSGGQTLIPTMKQRLSG